MDRSKGEQAVTTARQEGLRYYAYYWIALSSQPSSFCTSFCSPSCSFFILFLYRWEPVYIRGLSTLIPMPKHDRAYLFTSESCSNAGIFCRMRLLFETRMKVFAEPWRFRAPATCPLIRTLDINPKKTSREEGSP
jgi:hypothetical protein